MKLRIYCSLYAYAILNDVLISHIDCECVLPLSSGTWISSSRGTWTIPDNRTVIQNFKATLAPSQTTYDLTCISSSGSQYILGTSSGIELFPGLSVNSYTCIEIRTTSHSPSKNEFYFVTDIDIATGEPFALNASTVCDGTVAETASNTNILVADGTNAETVKDILPDVIRGDYTVTVTDQNGATGNQTLLGSCNDTSAFYFTEIVNATQTVSAIGFSDSGVLYNMKYFTSNNITYIYSYNNDTSVNSATTYRFSCWAVAQASNSSTTVYATVYPEVCQDGQNATYVPSGGQAMILEPSVTCPAETNTSKDSSRLSVAVIAVIVLVCVIVVAVVVVVIVYVIRKKNRKDGSKPVTEEEANGKPGVKGTKRAKSSNDLDSARLVDEKNKQKLAKRLAKKKETRTIAVQASIWTAPIKRTTTALKEGLKRADSQGSLKFIPYIDKQVIKPKQPADIRSFVPRSNTTLGNKSSDTGKPIIIRSNTTIERNGVGPRAIPKYLLKKNKVSSPRKTLIKQISNIVTHSTEHYGNEFEKRFPFPLEGNPNEFHNTLDIPDETEGTKDTDKHETSEETPRTVQEVNENEQSVESQKVKTVREFTKISLKSRPSTTDGVLGVNLNKSGSVRKSNSEKMERSKTILKFSYNSPYAMSETQKEYSSQKADWIRQQVQKDMQSKKHIEEMRKLEGQRAFDNWMKNKRKSISTVRRQFSKTSSKSPRTNRSLVESSKSST